MISVDKIKIMYNIDEEEVLENLSKEEKAIRINRLLELINSTNLQIKLCHEHEDEFGVRQYQRLKKQFMDELAELLGTYELQVQIQDPTLQKAA